MNKLFITLILGVLFVLNAQSQSIQDLINQVDINRLELMVSELSGEQATVVYGNNVTITSRINNINDLAADYIKERLENLGNLVIEDQAFNVNGRNIIATQIGQTNPDDIYLICAHYDSVAAYCADDNATGVSAVLEIARILSTQCIDNTIVYALWDEEEIGLLGAGFYASQAADRGDNILGVLNMDMMGYDGDEPGTPGDNEWDIDVRNIANSLAMKDDIVNVYNTYTFDLKPPIVVNPGTTASDHSRFWNVGYSAVLVGESWATNDQTPFYHTPNDRLATLDLPYFHELTKLVMAYTATKAGLIDVDNMVTINSNSLTANQLNATSYQWYDCDTNLPIANETNRTFIPSANGLYRVEVTNAGCTESSDCLIFATLGLENFAPDEVTIYPNPTSTNITVSVPENQNFKLDIKTVSGKTVLSKNSLKTNTTIDITELSSGVYFVTVSTSKKTGTYKVVKE